MSKFCRDWSTAISERCGDKIAENHQGRALLSFFDVELPNGVNLLLNISSFSSLVFFSRAALFRQHTSNHDTTPLDMRRDVQEIFRATPHHKQVMMFSATLAKEIRATCKKFMANVSVYLLDVCLHFYSQLYIQPLEIFVDDETKLTLHGLHQHYVKLEEIGKNRKLNELLDTLEFNQVGNHCILRSIFPTYVYRSLSSSSPWLVLSSWTNCSCLAISRASVFTQVCSKRNGAYGLTFPNTPAYALT